MSPTRNYTLLVKTSGCGRSSPMRVLEVLLSNLGIVATGVAEDKTRRACQLSISGSANVDEITCILQETGFIPGDVVIIDPEGLFHDLPRTQAAE